LIFDGLGEDLLAGLGPEEPLGAFVVALDEMLIPAISSGTSW
jgi:hypothetical protein